jgi:hypothetical protein
LLFEPGGVRGLSLIKAIGDHRDFREIRRGSKRLDVGCIGCAQIADSSQEPSGNRVDEVIVDSSIAQEIDSDEARRAS